MGIDASIYQNLRPIQMPDMLEAQGKAANLSSLAMNQARGMKQMAREDKDQAFTDHLRKASVIGNALESISGLSEEERRMAYPTVRQELLQAGVLKPEDAPEEYDPGLYRQNLMRYRNSKEGIEMQMKKAEIAKLQREAQNPAKNLTPGEEMADKSFGTDAADYFYGGGKANVEKNYGRLENAIGKLSEKGEISGGLSTKLPWLGQDEQQDWVNPEMAAVRDDIRAAIQGSLKQILGGQFTQREADAMFARAFNPRLSDAENIRRATAELDALKSMAADKDGAMKHFMAQGTLKGYQPRQSAIGKRTEYAAEPSSTRGFGALDVPSAQAAKTPPKLRHGTVEDGYVYMGGDPANPKSWKKER